MASRESIDLVGSFLGFAMRLDFNRGVLDLLVRKSVVANIFPHEVTFFLRSDNRNSSITFLLQWQLLLRHF